LLLPFIAPFPLFAGLRKIKFFVGSLSLSSKDSKKSEHPAESDDPLPQFFWIARHADLCAKSDSEKIRMPQAWIGGKGLFLKGLTGLIEAKPTDRMQIVSGVL
jgi:hypothetical protein